MPEPERKRRPLTKEQRERKREVDRQYDASLPGIKRRMVNRHGYPPDDAHTLAVLLTDDMSRCAICGVPNWIVRSIWRRGGPFPPVNQHHKNNFARLHVDHITPGAESTIYNTRLLCPGCNYKRGAATHTDDYVLDFMRWWWQEKYPARLLWWLNTSPGKGGRARRNEFCAQREERWERMNGTTSRE